MVCTNTHSVQWIILDRDLVDLGAVFVSDLLGEPESISPLISNSVNICVRELRRAAFQVAFIHR